MYLPDVPAAPVFQHDEALLEQLVQELQERTEPNRDAMWDGLSMEQVKDVAKTYAMQMLRRQAYG